MREVARQIDGALFERVALSQPKLSTALRALHPRTEREFKDAYLLEFLYEFYQQAIEESPPSKSTPAKGATKGSKGPPTPRPTRKKSKP